MKSMDLLKLPNILLQGTNHSTTTHFILIAGRSMCWDGSRISDPGQNLAKPGFHSSRKHESAKISTDLGLKSITITTTYN